MSAGFTAGQGSLPEVPGSRVNCDKCDAGLSLENGRLPYKCPVCKKVLRAASDSIFSNFLFALRRGFSISGRSTRAEFWTADIITSVLFLILLFAPLLYLLNDNGSFLNSSLYFILTCIFGCFLILVYQICISVRRLHDIGRSGWWILLAIILPAVNLAFFFVPLGVELYNLSIYYNDYYELMEDLMIIDDEKCIMLSSELTGICSIPEPTLVRDWLHLETRLNHPLHGYPIYFSLIDRTVFILNSILSVLLVIAFFLDSQKGSNKYGLSQKYPVE